MWSAILGLINAGLSAWSTYSGGQKQQAANDRTFAQQSAFDTAQNAYNVAEDQRNWQWKSQKRDYERQLATTNDMINRLNQQPAQHANLVALWSK